MRTLIAVPLLLCLLAAGAEAQTATPVASPRPRLKIDVSKLELVDHSRTDRWSQRPDAQVTSRSPRRSAGKKILGAVVGGTAGFFAGGYTGAWIEGDRCHCDDPGLMGAVIGAPIGAVAGGILGALDLF